MKHKEHHIDIKVTMIIHALHPEFEDDFVCLKDKGYRFSVPNQTFDLFLLNEKELVLQWHGKEDVEWYVKTPSGEFAFDGLYEIPDSPDVNSESSFKIPRIGMLRIFQEAFTIIPCLKSVCPVFDHIAVVYHNGANNDGSIDLVRQFIEEGKFGNCSIELHHYPYNVYFNRHPWYEEGNWHIDHPQAFGSFSDFALKCTTSAFLGTPFSYTLLDADIVYITEAMKERFDIAEEMYLSGKTCAIDGARYNMCILNNELHHIINAQKTPPGDHVVFNPYYFPIGYNRAREDDWDLQIAKHQELEDNRISYKKVIGFEVRRKWKKTWYNPRVYKEKEPIDHSIIEPITDEAVALFKKHALPLFDEDTHCFFKNIL